MDKFALISPLDTLGLKFVLSQCYHHSFIVCQPQTFSNLPQLCIENRRLSLKSADSIVKKRFICNLELLKFQWYDFVGSISANRLIKMLKRQIALCHPNHQDKPMGMDIFSVLRLLVVKWSWHIGLIKNRTGRTIAWSHFKNTVYSDAEWCLAYIPNTKEYRIAFI